MGSAMWAPCMESWIGCAICEQRERPSSRVGVVLKRLTSGNCPKMRRPSCCKQISRTVTRSLATTASPQTLHLRHLSVRCSPIRCLCLKGNSTGAAPAEMLDMTLSVPTSRRKVENIQGYVKVAVCPDSSRLRRSSGERWCVFCGHRPQNTHHLSPERLACEPIHVRRRLK